MIAAGALRPWLTRMPRAPWLTGRRALIGGLLALVVLPAMVLRIDAADRRPGQPSADERAYVRLAKDLRAGSGYGDSGIAHPLHWAPGAPVLFALADAVSGKPANQPLDTHAARSAQAVVGGLTIVAAFALAALIGGAWAGLAAAVAVAFYPPMIYATTQLTSEILGALAVTVALGAVAWAWTRDRMGAYAAAGVALGAACLVRADVLAAALVLGPVAGLLRARRVGWRRGLAVAGVTLAGVLAIVGPWSTWASIRDRTFVPITDGGPTTLFVATYLPGHGTIFGLKHALARAAVKVHPSIRNKPIFKEPEKVFLDAVAARHPHLTRNAAISAEVRRNLRVYLLGHPVAFGKMVAAKIWRMWGFPFRGRFRGVTDTTIWVHRALLALALAGALAALVRRRSTPLVLVAVVLAATATVDVAFVAEARHAFRLFPSLLAAGAAGWALTIRARRQAAAG
ncbi:MAG: hypothetical protein QOC78_3626 [Solirubrobacteraceae bacterium]|nr:hypothetical protein [Solirubrobacteraceae bacterium]MEA2278666.1 hypothetical protein [Solirubrobacteraceae bacterium]